LKLYPLASVAENPIKILRLKTCPIKCDLAISRIDPPPKSSNCGLPGLHYFEGLSYWDYALTVLKFLIWLAGLFVEGPAAVAVGAMDMALNISALLQKLNDYDEVFK
jgi:hypothetical protein